MLNMTNLICFITGGFLTGIVVCFFAEKKLSHIKEKYIKLKAQTKTSEEFRETIRQDFINLASETIKNEQEDLRKQNRESLEEKLFPLSKDLKEFREKLEKFNISGIENTTKIVEQIGALEKNNKVIEQEAKNLVDALTKNQNIKGAYGESLLDTILQSCGMQEGIHYTKQLVTTSESYNETLHTIRPDVVLNLPDNRHVIIDSKVTLKSYLDYINDETKLKEFKNEVKKRISDLSCKNYQYAENLYQPDFVLMYMPVETSVNILYQDYELIQKAYNSNVIIVGTSSLLTTLRLINQLFAQQKQNENVSNIVKAGTNLYETFVQFCEELTEVQKRCENVSTLLMRTINRFKRNNKNKPGLFSQIEALKEYGITSAKQIPSEFFETTFEGVNMANENGVIND